MSHKILIGQFLLEANTFAPGQTNLSDFEKTGLWIGNDLKRKKLPEEDELANIFILYCFVPELSQYTSLSRDLFDTV